MPSRRKPGQVTQPDPISGHPNECACPRCKDLEVCPACGQQKLDVDWCWHCARLVFRAPRQVKEPKGLAGAARGPATAKETTQRGAIAGAGDDAKRDGGPASPGGSARQVNYAFTSGWVDFIPATDRRWHVVEVPGTDACTCANSCANSVRIPSPLGTPGDAS